MCGIWIPGEILHPESTFSIQKMEAEKSWRMGKKNQDGVRASRERVRERLPKFLNILSDICESSGGCANSPSLSHSFPFCDSKPSSLDLSPPPSAASDLKTHHVRRVQIDHRRLRLPNPYFRLRSLSGT
ncbi:hypothetical protein ACFX2F_038545 [Malus domestica]